MKKQNCFIVAVCWVWFVSLMGHHPRKFCVFDKKQMQKTNVHIFPPFRYTQTRDESASQAKIIDLILCLDKFKSFDLAGVRCPVGATNE